MSTRRAVSRSLPMMAMTARQLLLPDPVSHMASVSVITPGGTRHAARHGTAASEPAEWPPGRAARYLESTADPADLPGLLGEWVAGLDERQRAVFEHRIATTDRARGDIGRGYGLSRERIRRMEIELAAALSAWLQGLAVGARVDALQVRLVAACPVLARWEELARAVPELAGRIPGTGACLGDLAGILLPELHRDGPWAGWGSVTRLRAQTVQLAVGSKPVGRRAAVLAAYRQTLGLEDRQWDGWLDHCGLRRFRGWVVRSGATVAELAEAILAEEGHPMTAADIAVQIPVPRWQLRNSCLGADDRFRRTGLGVFGLAEWPLPAYLGIREHLIEQITAAGGRARLQHVVTDLAERFGVSKSSIYACARGPEFTRSGSMIVLADQHQAQQPG